MLFIVNICIFILILELRKNIEHTPATFYMHFSAVYRGQDDFLIVKLAWLWAGRLYLPICNPY